jgi:misacylated tRNA(Ala) deacylase
MTELLYTTDSYRKEFDAQVVARDELNRAVLLDRTAFYPGGGGQPNDLGLLVLDGAEIPVVKVKKGPEGIWHFMGETGDLPALGAQVNGRLDWARRYALMRTHTAMHILCGVVFRDYGAQVTGGDMEPLSARMDFEFESLSRDLIEEIETAVNREIAAAHEIRVRILPRDEAFQIPDLIRTKINLLPPGIEQIRTVELVGLDLQADGGTHVHNTAEVGRMRIRDYKSKGKINKRIYVEIDDGSPDEPIK